MKLDHSTRLATGITSEYVLCIINMQLAFALNPVYRHIAYIREVVLAGSVPSLEAHLTLAGFALAAFLAGAFMYKHYNTRFLYYV